MTPEQLIMLFGSPYDIVRRFMKYKHLVFIISQICKKINKFTSKIKIIDRFLIAPIDYKIYRALFPHGSPRGNNHSGNNVGYVFEACIRFIFPKLSLKVSDRFFEIYHKEIIASDLINNFTLSGHRPLCKIIDHGVNINAVKSLLRHGAKINYGCGDCANTGAIKYECDLLHTAITVNRYDIANLLLANGYKLLIPNSYHMGYYADYALSLLYIQLSNSNIGGVEDCLKKYKDDLDVLKVEDIANHFRKTAINRAFIAALDYFVTVLG